MFVKLVNILISNKKHGVQSVININGGMELTVLNGELSTDLIDYYLGSHIFVVNSKGIAKVTIQNNEEVFIPPGTFYCHKARKINIPSGRLIVIFGVNYLKNEMSSLPAGIITTKYESALSDIIDFNNGLLEFESKFSIVMWLLLIECSLNKTTSKIIKTIKDNSHKKDYALDDLCREINVSRRKAQYQLSGMGTTFSQELKKSRVQKLKEIINNKTFVKHKMSYLVSLAGFNNLLSAKRDFLHITKVTLSDFKSINKRQCK